MRGISRICFVAVVTAGLALVVSGSLSAGARSAGPAAVTANSVVFVDSTGDSGTAPDINTVRVSNDDAGLVSFAVAFTNRTSLGATELLAIDLDTDANATTGDQPLGFDYGIQLYGGESTLWRWDATALDWVIAPMNTLTARWSGSTVTLSVSAKELGGTKAFRFGVISDANPDDEAAPIDLGPDFGRDLWAYDVKLYVAPTLAITKVDCTPEPGIRGRTLTGFASVQVRRAGVPESLAKAAIVKWQATIGNVTLKTVTTRVAPGATGAVLRSTWKLPTAVTAKSVRVKVTVTMEKVTVTKTHVHRVR